MDFTPCHKFPVTIEVNQKQSEVPPVEVPPPVDNKLKVLIEGVANLVAHCGSENRPLMLERIKKGPFQFGTIPVPGTTTTPATTRDRILDDLTPEEKIRKACNIKETNIILQGLPPDIYALVNHHTDAKETSSNLKNQATIQDGRVIVQNVQGRQTQSYTGNVARGNDQNTENATVNQSKEKMLLEQAQEVRFALEEEQLAFLVDTKERVDSGTDDRTLTTTAIFQIDDLDAFNSDCDEAPTRSVVFMQIFLLMV
uniref:G patch domain-containing protein TGH n=1 Tax=Tanacetum cinerariifolium TaxID=118510 RepID=A0A6L2JTM1_TANCI|nr:G patch domain-containing protein TGH [Tanacetum cinerariifolium]